METKYSEQDWKEIVGVLVEYGCSLSAALRVLRENYPRFQHLSRQTLRTYLQSHDGALMYRAAWEEYKQKRLTAQDALPDKDLARLMSLSLYELWEICVKRELACAALGDREAGRMAMQYLRLGSRVPRYDEAEEFWKEEKESAAPALAGGAGQLVVCAATAARGCGSFATARGSSVCAAGNGENRSYKSYRSYTLYRFYSCPRPSGERGDLSVAKAK